MIMSSYGIGPDLRDDDALLKVLDIFSAVVFYVPAVSYSKAFQNRGYLFPFKLQKSFPGHSWAGVLYSRHRLHISNFTEHLSRE